MSKIHTSNFKRINCVDCVYKIIKSFFLQFLHTVAYRETRRYTGFNSEGRGKSEYLDRHWMACPNGMGIRGFRLERNGGGNYR